MVKKSSMKFCYTIIIFLSAMNMVFYAAEEAVGIPQKFIRQDKIRDFYKNFEDSKTFFQKIFGYHLDGTITNALTKTEELTYDEAIVAKKSVGTPLSLVSAVGGIGKFILTSGIDLYWKSAEYEQRERHAVHDQRVKEIISGRDSEFALIPFLDSSRKEQAINEIQNIDHFLIDVNQSQVLLDRLKKLSKTTKNEELKDIYELFCQFELHTDSSQYNNLFLHSRDYEDFINQVFNDANTILNNFLKIVDSPKHCNQLSYDDYTTIINILIPGLYKRSSTISRSCVNNIERMDMNKNPTKVSTIRNNVEVEIESINRRALKLHERFKRRAKILKTKSIDEKHNPSFIQNVWNNIKNIFTSEKSVNFAATAANTSATIQHVATTTMILGVGGAFIYAIIKYANK